MRHKWLLMQWLSSLGKVWKQKRRLTMKADGGAAFPHEVIDMECGLENRYTEPGMTLRDYFAGQALAAAYDAEKSSPTHNGLSYRGAAERAYLFADALLAERERTGE
jgi:hypothetical protein